MRRDDHDFEDPADRFEREWEEANAWDDAEQPTVELERIALDATLPAHVRKRAERARLSRQQERDRTREVTALRQENERLHAELGRALLALDDPTTHGEEVAHNRALMLALRSYPDYKAGLRQLGPRASDAEVIAWVERDQMRRGRKAAQGWRQALTRRGRK